MYSYFSIMHTIFSKSNNLVRKGILFHPKSKIHETHYEVLDLPPNCTLKDVKQSYIKLSKQYHPDRNKDESSHAKFVQILAAYNVLSKPDLRRNYDLSLIRQYKEYRNKPAYNPWNDPIFYTNQDKRQHQFYESQPYYGIKRVNRMSNLYVATVCCCVATIGVGLQVLIIRKSIALKRAIMMQKSIEAEEALRESRLNASNNGNLVQIEIMKERLERNKYNNTPKEK